MADTDILVSEMTPASQINTTDLMIMTQPDAQAETGYTTKSGTVLQVTNKQLKGIDFPTDLPSFDNPNVIGGLEELKADIKALLPISSAVGNPCTFDTDISDTLVSLKAAIVATGGNGTPTTPIPIVGHSELNLVRCGKNLFDTILASQTVNDVAFTVNSDKTITANGTANGNIFLQIGSIHIIAGQTYTLTGCSSGGGSGVYSLYASLKGGNKNDYGSGVTFTATTTEDAPVRIAVYNTKTINGIYKPQLELGSTATAYEPYNDTPYLVSFGQTVYGGEYDANRGKVTDTFGNDNLADLNWTYSSGDGWFQVYHNTHKHPASGALCSCYPVVYTLGADFVDKSIAVVSNYLAIKDSSFGGDVNALKTALAGQTLCYELATPIEIDVSELSVEAVSGVNNIVSDGGGDVEVQYRDSIQHYIDSKIASVQALIL